MKNYLYLFRNMDSLNAFLINHFLGIGNYLVIRWGFIFLKRFFRKLLKK
jgi:hypothetical protein